MAVKYLAGDRLIGTAAERAALTTTTESGADTVWTISNPVIKYNTTTNEIYNTDGGQTGGTTANARAYIQMKDSGGSTITAGETWCLQAQWTYVPNSNGWNGDVRPIGLARDTTGAADTSTGTGGYVGAYGDTNFNMYWRDEGSASPAGYITGGESSNGGTTAYMTMIRTNGGDAVECRYFGQSGRSSALTGGNDFGNNGNTTGIFGGTYSSVIPTGGLDNMTYIMCSNGSSSTAHGWKVRTIKFWNNQLNDSGDPDWENVYDYSLTYNYPNLPNGAIFEQSDDGKHYMWDGTNTWNEIT